MSVRLPQLGLLVSLFAALWCAPPAAALQSCGSLGQPTCTEAPAPGVELVLAPEDNPHGLTPLTATPSAGRPLLPRVRGHKPYGFNAVAAGHHGTTVEDEAFLHEQMGASIARVTADWAMIQYYPNLAAGGRPWDYATYLDETYRAYIRRGIRPILTISRTPRRFTVRAATRRNSKVVGCGTSDACWNPPRPDAVGALRSFVADLVKRYPLAAGVEFWNEPNLSNPFWGGERPDPEYYASLLDTVHDEIKRVRPRMPVISGGLANFDASRVDRWGYQIMSQRSYLARMLKAGAAADMDAVGYHPYLGSYPTWSSDRAKRTDYLFAQMLASDRRVRQAFADARVAMRERFVVTEFGASTSDGWSEHDQSAWLLTQYALWDTDHRNLPLASRTDAAIAHASVEDPTAAAAFQSGFGFVRVKDASGRFTPKPAYCSFRTRYGGFSSCPETLGR